jgi:hypothetical protein
MPISDYASAFFFVHRKRVTLRRGRTLQRSRGCYFKSLPEQRPASIRRGDREFLTPAFPHSGRKNTDAGNSHGAVCKIIQLQKAKKPGNAGPVDEFHFQSVHFASLAI